MRWQENSAEGVLDERLTEDVTVFDLRFAFSRNSKPAPLTTRRPLNDSLSSHTEPTS